MIEVNGTGYPQSRDFNFSWWLSWTLECKKIPAKETKKPTDSNLLSAGWTNPVSRFSVISQIKLLFAAVWRNSIENENAWGCSKLDFPRFKYFRHRRHHYSRHDKSRY